MGVKKVTAFKVGGKIYETESEANKADARRKLMKFCQENFGGGNYSSDMIAGVLEENAGALQWMMASIMDGRAAS